MCNITDYNRYHILNVKYFCLICFTLSTEKPTYQGSWPQNRFGVRPGYRWDGIDRSNGYENTQYALKAEKKAQEEFAYKWSVEDM